MLTLTLTRRHVLHLTVSYQTPLPVTMEQESMAASSREVAPMWQTGAPIPPAPPSFFSLSSHSCHTHILSTKHYPGQAPRATGPVKDGGSCCISRVLMAFPRRRAHNSTHGSLRGGRQPLQMWAHLCCPLFLSMVHAGITLRECPFIRPPPVDMKSR